MEYSCLFIIQKLKFALPLPLSFSNKRKWFPLNFKGLRKNFPRRIYFPLKRCVPSLDLIRYEKPSLKKMVAHNLIKKLKINSVETLISVTFNINQLFYNKSDKSICYHSKVHFQSTSISLITKWK